MLKQLLVRFSKYTLVAGVLFIGNIAIAYRLREELGVSNLIATFCGMFLQGVLAFFINRRVVFKSPNTPAKTGLLKVAVLEAGAFALVLFLTWVGEYIFLQTFLVSRTSAGILALMCYYTLDAIWVFKSPTKVMKENKMSAKLLPLPGLTESAMLTYQNEYACGFLAIDMVAFIRRQSPPLQGPRWMPSVFLRHVFTSILPYDLEQNLRHLGLQPISLILNKEETVGTLKQVINGNTCAIIFVGVGAGHWLTLWGYDEESQEFLVFDSGKTEDGRRDMNQLTRYSYENLVELMFHQVWAQWLCNLLSPLYPRLQASPGTVVVTK